MEIQLLTVPDCPHRSPTLDHLREALERAGRPDAVVVERQILDAAEAAAVGMHGSPTVLVDGRDPFTATPEPSLSCRLYSSEAGLQGSPSIDDLVEALTG
jgi:hypothetical protein